MTRFPGRRWRGSRETVRGPNFCPTFRHSPPPTLPNPAFPIYNAAPGTASALMPRPLSIIIVEPDRDRALLIVDSLRAAGDFEIQVISEPTSLARQIQARQPDVVLIDIENPSRDMLEELALASGPQDRAVAMFVDRSEDGLSTAAIEAGVSAYVVDGLQPGRIKPVLDAAITRFRMFQRMRTELAEMKRALEDRKVIDRAKGMLMKARGVSEDEAYALLRKAAMDQGKRVADVAQALVTAAGLLG